MDRVACVDITALPLQILLKRHSDWREDPVVVVDRDAAQGTVCWMNQPARTAGIRAGMRYAAALSITHALRGAHVPACEIQRTLHAIKDRLWRFSPGIETCPEEPGVLWLEADGLSELFPSLASWGTTILSDLEEFGFRARLAVGFTRFGAYAAARSSPRVMIFSSGEDERAHLRSVSLRGLHISLKLRDNLEKLGIDTLGGFMDLPAESIRKRFGGDAHRIHQAANGAAWEPCLFQSHPLPIHRNIDLDFPERNATRLLALVSSHLPSMVDSLNQRNELLRSITLRIQCDKAECITEQLAPATPTLDVAGIHSLLKIRFDALHLPSGVNEISMVATGVEMHPRQVDLFSENRKRDEQSIERAFARIRADLGNDAVQVARCCDRHIPEASFRWVPVHGVKTPEPSAKANPVLVRRFYTPAISLPAQFRDDPDGWLVMRFQDGPVEEVIGPHILNGGWWSRIILRSYAFVRTRSGRWLWIYKDKQRRRWVLQGEVN